jgi:Cof subfamily protein (haloacid dehalogenase superfamily)
MVDYKAVAMDLDDTLLTTDLQISAGTKRILMKCQKEGMHIILASGRPIYAIEKYARELELEKYGGYIVGFNGAAVKDCKAQRLIMQKNLPKEYIRTLYELSVKNGVFIHTYVGDEIITPQNNPYTEIEGKLTGMSIRETENFLKSVDREVVKVLMLENPEYLKMVYEKLSTVLGNELSLTISKPYFLEIMDKGIEKSAALLHICNKIGMKKEQLIAFGDSYNDLSMLTTAGLGIAMGNAQIDIKKQADYVTDGNDEDGIANALCRFVFKETQLSLTA